jgi:hypothetical protein
MIAAVIAATLGSVATSLHAALFLPEAARKGSLSSCRASVAVMGLRLRRALRDTSSTGPIVPARSRYESCSRSAARCYNR